MPVTITAPPKAEPERLMRLVERINAGEIKIPKFQRGFVWQKSAVLELLESLLQGYPICRLHDLRHTAITKLGEKGTPEATLLAIVGHMSRKMLDRYSHIRVNAKRDAMATLALTATPKDPILDAVPAKSTAMGGRELIN